MQQGMERGSADPATLPRLYVAILVFRDNCIFPPRSLRCSVQQAQGKVQLSKRHAFEPLTVLKSSLNDSDRQ